MFCGQSNVYSFFWDIRYFLPQNTLQNGNFCYLIQVTNQLVSTCKSFLTKTLKKSKSGESEKFWTIVEKELSSITSIEPSTGTKSKRGNSEPDKLKESFLARLHSCATLHKQYVENLCHLRDGLGGVNSLQHVPGPAIGAALAKKAVSASQGNISTSPSRILPSTVSPYTFGKN